MVLTKEDFYDLTVLELLQNLWDYRDTYHYIKIAKHWPQLLLYGSYCKERLREK